MNLIAKIKPLVAAAAMIVAGSAVSAAPCTNAGAKLWTDKDNGVKITASSCENYMGNIGASTKLIDGLNDGNFFGGMFDPETEWTLAGKDEKSGDQGGNVEAQIGERKGDWAADFGSKLMITIVVAFHGGKNGSKLFLFKDLANVASFFEGRFHMKKAGLQIMTGTGEIKGQDLSNLSVAGTYVCYSDDKECDDGGTGGAVPLPAGLPLMLTVLGLGGFAARRARKKSS